MWVPGHTRPMRVRPVLALFSPRSKLDIRHSHTPRSSVPSCSLSSRDHLRSCSTRSAFAFLRSSTPAADPCGVDDGSRPLTTHRRGHRLPSVDDESFRVTVDGRDHLRLPSVYGDPTCETCPALHFPRPCLECSTGIAHADLTVPTKTRRSRLLPHVWRCQDCGATGNS